MVVWGLPFIGVGLYLLFGRFLQTLYLRDKTFYIITNKKLIIRSGNKVRIYRAEDLPPDGHPSAQKRHRNHPVFRD